MEKASAQAAEPSLVSQAADDAVAILQQTCEAVQTLRHSGHSEASRNRGEVSFRKPRSRHMYRSVLCNPGQRLQMVFGCRAFASTRIIVCSAEPFLVFHAYTFWTQAMVTQDLAECWANWGLPLLLNTGKWSTLLHATAYRVVDMAGARPTSRYRSSDTSIVRARR